MVGRELEAQLYTKAFPATWCDLGMLSQRRNAS